MKLKCIKTTGYLFVLSLLLGNFTSCVSQNVTAKTVDPNYLGDYDPIQLENIVAIQKTIKSTIKPLEYELYFIPRSNNVEAYYRTGVTSYALVLNPETRGILYEGIKNYMEAYNTNNLPKQTSNEDVKFSTGILSIAWGVTGVTHNGDADFYTSYEMLDNKPYFLLLVKNANDENGSGVSSWQRLYFSPSQLEKVVTQLNQSYLQSLVDNLDNEAYAF